MGLDMYAYTAPREMVGDAEVDVNDMLFADGSAKEGVNTDFKYWRKFNNLHGWMQRLYQSKGGESDSFNCNTVVLNEQDLERLESDASSLEPTGGFFFGSENAMSQDDIDEVLSFVTDARAAIAEGMVVIYDSWW